MTSALVLNTINAPHNRRLNASQLVDCLLDPRTAMSAPGHMSAFFGEVRPDLQIAFADAHRITREQLVAAAKAFGAYSGESYPLSL